MNIYSNISGVHIPPQHLNTCGQNVSKGSVWEEGDKETGGEGGEGWRCMKVYGNTQTDESSLNCKQGVLPGIQESKYHPIRGKWMKEGKVWDGVQAFLLLCLHQLNSPIFHSDYTLPTAVLPALSHRKVRLESFALFEVSVRDTGSNRRKKLISPHLIPSLALFVPLPLKSFVFEFVTQILFSRRTKAMRKPPPCMTMK